MKGTTLFPLKQLKYLSHEKFITILICLKCYVKEAQNAGCHLIKVFIYRNSKTANLEK